MDKEALTLLYLVCFTEITQHPVINRNFTIRSWVFLNGIYCSLISSCANALRTMNSMAESCVACDSG